MSAPRAGQGWPRRGAPLDTAPSGAPTAAARPASRRPP